MNTPIYDFLKKYSDSKALRLHMPGHKGKRLSELPSYEFDITEIKGADSLFEADGIIEESENNTSKLYKRFYSMHTGDALADETGEERGYSCKKRSQKLYRRLRSP